MRDRLIEYLENVLGMAPLLRPMARERLGGAPVYLLGLYDFVETELFGRTLVLGLANEQCTGLTPREYADQLAAIQRAVGVSTALVLPSLKSYERGALVERGVPFIVPKRQMFLPQLMIDLREYFPKPTPPARDVLSGAAQLLLLYHLQQRPVEGASMRAIAPLVGYSTMTLSNVGRELAAAPFCTLQSVGRSKRLRFAVQGRELWEEARAHLASPVRALSWVAELPVGVGVLKAGLSALSDYTSISDDRLPTYALHGRVLRGMIRRGSVSMCESPDEAVATVQSWSYDPVVLGDGRRVDRLSLFLSLQTSTDERIQGAMDELLEEVAW